MPKVSVIIPCYNLGKYIHDAIDSVTEQTFQDFEIIIVNDGSTGDETIQILNNLNTSSTKVIHTDNQGPSKARNTGIIQASGDYILSLDADDKIASTYLEKAVKILEQNENIGIVYCYAEFFGEENFKWDLPDYTLSRILIDNLIFCSAFFRKKDWKTAGGYKESMRIGWEDYDFWLSIIELGREVYRIPEHLFFYRIRKDSRSSSIKNNQIFLLYKELAKNHKDLYLNNIEHIFEHIYSLRELAAENKNQLIEKDTHIHNLNMEISKLNSYLSDSRTLTRLLLGSIKKKCSVLFK